MLLPETINADVIAQELSERGMDHADKDAAYRALDDLTKTVLAEAMIDYAATEKSSAGREMRALASRTYKDHLAALAAARRAANRAKVHFETYRAWVELRRTVAATDRALMGMR